MTACTKEDGIYQIKLTDDNPFNEYLIVKTYGNVKKQRSQPTIVDCRQQEEEWDEDYMRIDPHFVGEEVPIHIEKLPDNTSNNYEIYDLEGCLVDKGKGKYLAERYGTSSKNLCNAALENRTFKSRITGQTIKYKVVKILCA